jgi:two-component system sensor histidine kinase MprB
VRERLSGITSRFRGMSFRARIALAASVAVAIAVIVASALAYVLVRNELVSNVDSQLRERAQSFIDRPRPLSIGPVYPPAKSGPFGAASGYFQIVTSDGQAHLTRGEFVGMPVSKRIQKAAQGGQKSFHSELTIGGEHVRILTVPISLTNALTGTTESAALMVALPLNDVDSVLHRLGWILFFVALGGVGIAGVLGYAVSRTALAPVRRLTTATEEITETRDLSRRVEANTRDEVGRLGTSFNTMLAALQESQQAQRQLVADASHELRTPLTSLRTNVELLARGTLPDEERKKAFADVMTQLEELTALVADVVEVARDGEPQLVEEDVRLDLLVGDAVERARLHRPKVRFYTELHESLVRGVPDRIFRAVSNVLDNAAKWSPADGNVGVRVEHGEVTVRDQGPGIAPEDLPHVFDRFYRSPAARATPGSGLGLAIVRQVVESHGGTVTAGPADGGGTVVRLAFPNGNVPSS